MARSRRKKRREGNTEPDQRAKPGQRYLFYATQPYAMPILRPLQAAIRRAGGEAAWFFKREGVATLKDDERRLKTVAEVRAFDPVAVLVPGNRVPHFFPGIKVGVFHGFSVGKRSDMHGHFRLRGQFDLYCTQGRTTTPVFEELAEEQGYFRVVETGWPKTDPLFAKGTSSNPWSQGWADKAPTILLASTFTPTLSAAPRLLESIRKLACDGPFNWLVTLHPMMPDQIVRAYKELQGPRLRFAGSTDLIPLMQAADLMVADTTSAVHEFLLQHKPVVTLRNTRPGPHLIDIQEPSELRSGIDRAMARPPELMRAIVEFADEIHPYRDGRSSERVLAATQDFIEHHKGRLKRKPLNLVRRIRVRHELGYYGW